MIYGPRWVNASCELLHGAGPGGGAGPVTPVPRKDGDPPLPSASFLRFVVEESRWNNSMCDAVPGAADQQANGTDPFGEDRSLH